MNDAQDNPSPNPNPARAERRDAAENRQRILNAAQKLFELQGVGQVSMNQIAQEAQIGPGTLYRRYRNKSELCLDLIKDQLVLLFDDIDAYLEANRQEAPGRRLRKVIALFLRFREKKAQLLTGVEDGGAPGRTRPRSQSPVYEELHRQFAGLFDELAAADDRPGPRPDSVFKADILLTALTRDAYLFQRDERGYAPEDILNQLCLIFLPAE
ncbi:transcriptional regulator, TetR family [Paenibacillus sp. UNC496MF]|uniref:TetR/AcrR family transcriptional regulator n=1 Tax=Paenibacillus sp. UNC496MF TaxID=1502753 RepID=UPI0008DF6589|nr:TetR/AcrR family transcriptional regulator [Paenibacillus sp. UNC496MF]SFJ70380.1 transcriptional regulator, TetR family [Paenibacillus sp. UNC496MF]